MDTFSSLNQFLNAEILPIMQISVIPQGRFLNLIDCLARNSITKVGPTLEHIFLKGITNNLFQLSCIYWP